MNPMMERANEALKRGGGMYDFEDVMDAIGEGRMQSFAEGDTWIVTQISNYPRKIVLEVVLAVGDIDEFLGAEGRITEFARENSCEMMMATGRLGWEPHLTPGWKKSAAVYIKESL